MRGAARRAGVSAGTAAGAIARMEAALSVDLLTRDGAAGTVTLAAQAKAPALLRLATLAEAIVAPDADPEAARRAAVRARVSVEALARLADAVDFGSIRAAAKSHGVGQPQLTRQLRRLEAVLGRPLLARGGTGSVPTVEGRRVAALAAELVALWRATAAAGPAEFRRSQRTVRFGTIVPLGHESRVARLVADVVAGWPKLRPGHPLTVKSTTAAELVTELKAGSLDVALLDAEPGPLGLDGVAVARIRLALALPPDAPRHAPAAALLRGCRLAVPSRRSGLRGRIDAVLAAFGAEPSDVTEIDSIPVIVDLVMRHGFISVLPLDSIRAVGGGIAAVALSPDFDLTLHLVTVAGRGEDRAVHDVLSLVAAAGPPI